MPVLPSGRVVGMLADRARYHAARLGLRVTPRTPHADLYPLVDILIEPPGGGRALVFSGHTLAERDWIDAWGERDAAAFLAWLGETPQVRAIERARRRLLAEDGPPREQVQSYPEHLYSLLRRRLEALPLARASARQWRRTLLNLRQDGVRREELDWSGVLEFLARFSEEAVVDRADVLGAIDLAPVRPRMSCELECDHGCDLPFREVAEKTTAATLRRLGYPVAAGDVGVVRDRCDGPDYRIGTIWPCGRPLKGDRPDRWFALGPGGQPLAERARLLFGSRREARRVAHRHALRKARLQCDLRYSHRYEYMTLHGGGDYREWLVTLPEYPRSYFNGHFHERNILLHLRTKVREGHDGARVLFVEEIQSDWHQALARYGACSGIPVAPFRREWVGLAVKLMLLHVAETGLDGIAWADAAVHELRYDQSLARLRRLYDQELPRALQRLARPWGGRLGSGRFDTRVPWLHATRCRESWKVQGGAGKFVTRARYGKQEAQAVIARHSPTVTLELPRLLLPEPMRRHIVEHGLPLFGMPGDL